MDHFETECTVIGAGVVGLACAAVLASRGLEVVVLERNAAFGEETSARNSEVIHAGIYYPPGSLKAKLCVEGKALLYDYCRDRAIGHRKLGKLIVASDEQDITAIREIEQRAIQNGVNDMRWLSGADARVLEPELRAVGALHSPSTGIVDSHGLMLSLIGDLESNNGAIVYRSEVTGIEMGGPGLSLSVDSDGSCYRLETRTLVNCAGLDAVTLARSAHSKNDGVALPEPFFTRGNYFRLSGKAPFKTLIYPAPVSGGLGVHLTLDLAGNARFGPDVEPVNDATASLQVNPARGDSFYASIRRYWPELPDHALRPDYAGIRPKIRWPDQAAADFAVLGPDQHGVPGLIHCLGIESPGLTGSLAIANLVQGQI